MLASTRQILSVWHLLCVKRVLKYFALNLEAERGILLRLVRSIQTDIFCLQWSAQENAGGDSKTDLPRSDNLQIAKYIHREDPKDASNDNPSCFTFDEFFLLRRHVFHFPRAFRIWFLSLRLWCRARQKGSRLGRYYTVESLQLRGQKILPVQGSQRNPSQWAAPALSSLFSKRSIVLRDGFML